MNATNVLERVPIHTDADGVVRVAGTRVTLDTIVGAFEAGAPAEAIAQQDSSVPLVDVDSVITYYLRHTPDVDVYLSTRKAQAECVREDVERRFPSAGLRERLLARRRQGASDAPFRRGRRLNRVGRFAQTGVEAMSKLDYRNVEKDAARAGGQAVVAGTRVRVATILACYRQGMRVEEIVQQYTHLRPADVHDALAYAYEHLDEIEADLAADDEAAVRARYGSSPSR